MSTFSFQQVDVFTGKRLKGNPLAVVIGADGLSDDAMASLANWTNLSETTFLLKPTTAEADYRLRIFTPSGELPFAGHPTLGSCHVWLSLGNTAGQAHVVQECGAGLIKIRRDGNRLAFAAPPLRRTGDVESDILDQIARGLQIRRDAIKAAQWIDNGPGWVAVMLTSRTEILSLKPDYPALGNLKLGVVAPWDPLRDGKDAFFEVRAFISNRATEDPVTGSLNAGLAQWLMSAGLAPAAYVASQGTVLGREGRVYAARDGHDIWIGGETRTCIEGRLTI
ncbi:PhzF family phenazine biosynthesis protein [Afipia broomeae]|uniref:Phenazine biosynthesis protein PhzF family protein n=1 Tax=Afipia broomeae ATCC 49717 TaxID=883078 RepID=K8NYV2_9BRAD|nr:PhzF family phenazine biosynthesis protein [Afipia broomeae]EKS34366.1 phenazine biosynthesis protein PhzF family protein [Afipia broomeae ATCC 49717]